MNLFFRGRKGPSLTFLGKIAFFFFDKKRRKKDEWLWKFRKWLCVHSFILSESRKVQLSPLLLSPHTGLTLLSLVGPLGPVPVHAPVGLSHSSFFPLFIGHFFPPHTVRTGSLLFSASVLLSRCNKGLWGVFLSLPSEG